MFSYLGQDGYSDAVIWEREERLSHHNKCFSLYVFHIQILYSTQLEWGNDWSVGSGVGTAWRCAHGGITEEAGEDTPELH